MLQPFTLLLTFCCDGQRRWSDVTNGDIVVLLFEYPCDGSVTASCTVHFLAASIASNFSVKRFFTGTPRIRWHASVLN